MNGQVNQLTWLYFFLPYGCFSYLSYLRNGRPQGSPYDPFVFFVSFVDFIFSVSPFTSYLYSPTFPEVIGYFVSECLLVFVRQAGEKTIADVVAGVLRGFVQDVAVPEDDVARFCMQFNGLNIFDQVEIFGVFSKAVVEVIGVFAKKFP